MLMKALKMRFGEKTTAFPNSPFELIYFYELRYMCLFFFVGFTVMGFKELQLEKKDWIKSANNSEINYVF